MCLPSCSGYEILFVHDIGTKSHLIQLYPIVEKLLDNGHQVTTIFFSKGNIKHENYTEIVVRNVFEDHLAGLTKVMMNRESQNAVVNSFYFMKFGLEAWSEVLEESAMLYWSSPEIQSMMASHRQFEAVITSFPQQHCLLAERFNSSLIMFSPAGPVPWLLAQTGNEINLSVQPLLTSSFIEPMSFVQRLKNHIESYIRHFSTTYVASKIYELRARKMGVTDQTYEEIMASRFSVFLSNHHPVTHGAWPYRPNIIEVGGLTLQEPKLLPSDLKSFLDSANNGAILVGFGSTLQPSQMPPEKLNVLLSVFTALSDYSFIWKWDGEVKDVPANVLTRSWLPQQDLLAHRNMKTFVTHGGLGGICEAIYHKVKLVGIPFGNDQVSNMERVVRHGYGKLLVWERLTAEDLRQAIMEAMESEAMSASLERVHSLYMDREARPVDRAVWWIEYVSRHGGAKVLQSTVSQVPSYQRHHLDIFLCVTTLLTMVALSVCFLCRLCCRCCRCRKVKKD